MASNYIAKIQYEGTLRRVAVGGELSFSQLVVRTRDLLCLSPRAELVFTYTDVDGDLVNMAGDGDLEDAFVLQGINPLRLNVAVAGLEKRIPAEKQEARSLSDEQSAISAAVEQEARSSDSDQSIIYGGGAWVDSLSALEKIPSLEETAEIYSGGAWIDSLAAAEETADGEQEATSNDSEQRIIYGGGAWIDSLAAAEETADGEQEATSNDSEQRIIYGGGAWIDSLDAAEETADGEQEATSNTENQSAIAGESNSPETTSNSDGPVDSRFFGDFWSGIFAAAKKTPTFAEGVTSAASKSSTESIGTESPSSKETSIIKEAVTEPADGVDSVLDGGVLLDDLAEPAKEVDSKVDQGAAPTATDNKVVGDAAEVKSGDLVHHYGVKCDLCGMFPLLGSRFKSKAELNYDLCRPCLETSGSSEDDYIRVDRSFNRLGYPFQLGKMFQLWPASSLTARNPRTVASTSLDHDPSKPSLDIGLKTCACAPAAHAINADTAPTGSQNSDADTVPVRHHGVQCDGCKVCPIVGPRLESRKKFNYDLCLGCFEKSGSDAGDYHRIERPGHGHPIVVDGLMRFAAPCGPLSGHRHWILKQIVERSTSFRALRDGRILSGDLEQEQAGANEAVRVADDAAPSGDLEQEQAVVNEAVRVAVDVAASGDLEQEQAGPNDAVRVAPDPAPSGNLEHKQAGANEAVRAADDVAPTGVLEEQAAEERETEIPARVTATADDAPVAQDGGVENSGEAQIPEKDLSTLEGSLAKLAAMGFSDQKLNTELLRKSGFDLTLDYLCAAEEWDPILEELQEMGFHDSDMNRSLMFKNNGNVKGVVKELVQLYKDPLYTVGEISLGSG